MPAAVRCHDHGTKKHFILQVIEYATQQAVNNDDEFCPAKDFLFHAPKLSGGVSIFQDIPDKVVVFREGGQVIMPAAMDADQRDLVRVELLQFLAMPDGDQPVAGAVNDIGMAIHLADPFIGMEVITQYPPVRQYRQEAFRHFDKTVIRRIEDQVAWLIVCSYFGGKTAAEAAAINKDIMLRIFFDQLFVHYLHIGQHISLTSFSCTLAKSTVINKHHIVLVTIEIAGIFCPAFDTAGIAMKVKDQSFRICTIEMKAVNAHAGRYIEKQFFKRRFIFILKILREFFRLENESVLDKINDTQ
jgi:hypothetical protein